MTELGDREAVVAALADPDMGPRLCSACYLRAGHAIGEARTMEMAEAAALILLDRAAPRRARVAAWVLLQGVHQRCARDSRFEHVAVAIEGLDLPEKHRAKLAMTRALSKGDWTMWLEQRRRLADAGGSA